MFDEPEEKVAMVYSYHPEYGTNNGGRAEQLWHIIKRSWDLGHRMRSYASGMPSELCPLQAADLFAYELSHEFENRLRRPKDKMRWPLRQIVGMYKIPDPRIHLYDRKELLRVIKESSFPDQTAMRTVVIVQPRHETPIKPIFERSLTFGIPGMANECWFVARHAGAALWSCSACAMNSRDFRRWRFRSGCLIPTCAAG